MASSYLRDARSALNYIAIVYRGAKKKSGSKVCRYMQAHRCSTHILISDKGKRTNKGNSTELNACVLADKVKVYVLVYYRNSIDHTKRPSVCVLATAMSGVKSFVKKSLADLTKNSDDLNKVKAKGAKKKKEY